jgi:hypothetical protein
LLNTMQIVAGDAGVIVTTRDESAASYGEPVIGPVWVLGEAGFERVEAPFTGLTGPSEGLQVWAVDSGFFVNKGAALGGDQLSGANAWFSPDGRTWTEVVDRPQQLMVTTAVGDTVYGVAQAAGVADADVISTDGGRTWTEAPERPTAVPPLPMAVDDQGFVTGAVADIGVVWVSADGVTWERAMNLWPPITIGAEPAWVNRDTMLLIIWETAVIGRIS